MPKLHQDVLTPPTYRPPPRPRPPVCLGAALHGGDLEFPVDLGPSIVGQRLVLGSRQGIQQGATKEETKVPLSVATPLALPASSPHQVLDGQLEVGDLPQRLIVPLHLIHALSQVLGVSQV